MRALCVALLLLLASAARCHHVLDFKAPHKAEAAHVCVYDLYAEAAVVERERVHASAAPPEAHLAVNGLSASRRKLIEATPTPSPIRLTAVYQLSNSSLSVATASFLQQQLIPAALAEMARFTAVQRPVSGVFHLPWSCASGAATCVGGTGKLCVGGAPGCARRQRYATCFSATSDASLFGASYVNCTARNCTSGVLEAGGPGLNNTDFALYVTAVDEPYCASGSVLAMGAPCEVDTWSGRPLSGNANFCPRALRVARAADGGNNSWGMQLDTALHELTHALGFSSRIFSQFVAADGATLLRPPAVAALPDWVNGSASYVVSSRVQAEAAAYFGDATLPGVALENSGAALTRGSHWEQRWLRGEMMTGVKLARSPFSRFTQALLNDSGWYAPTGGDLVPSGGLRWGAGAGGAFVTDSCLARPLPAAMLANGWCDNATSTVPDCTLDKRAVAYCGVDSSKLEDGCTSWVPFGNMHCWDPRQSSDGASVFGQSFGRGSRCLSFSSQTLTRQEWGTMPSSAGCFPMSCEAAPVDATHPSGLRLVVTVQVCDSLPCMVTPAPRAVLAECPPGGFIDLTQLGLDFTQGRLGPCPADPLAFCSSLGCSDDCGGDRGVCVNPSGLPGAGACVCNPGYVGPSCGEVACTAAACKLRGAACSALSGRCVAANGTQLLGAAVAEPGAYYLQAPTTRTYGLVAAAGAATGGAGQSTASTTPAPPLAAIMLALAGTMR